MKVQMLLNTSAVVKHGKMLYCSIRAETLLFFLSVTNAEGEKLFSVRIQFYRKGIIRYTVESQ